MRIVNVILIMFITVWRVFLTNPKKKRCRGCVRRISRSDETCRAEEGGKLTAATNSYVIFLTYIFELMINTAPPASNSVYRQDCAEKYFRYKNFSGAPNVNFRKISVRTTI